jgi:hypothetical protein
LAINETKPADHSKLYKKEVSTHSIKIPLVSFRFKKGNHPITALSKRIAIIAPVTYLYINGA